MYEKEFNRDRFYLRPQRFHERIGTGYHRRCDSMIERQKAKYGWEFLFLGANIDAVETASQFGIGADRAVNYQCDSEETALNYEVVSEAISSVRCSAPLSADWKKRIDEDYKKRGGRKHK